MKIISTHKFTPNNEQNHSTQSKPTSNNHYDQAVTRFMETSVYDDDPNPQLTEKIFIKSEYIFHLDSTLKNFDHIIDHALKNAQAYEPIT